MFVDAGGGSKRGVRNFLEGIPQLIVLVFLNSSILLDAWTQITQLGSWCTRKQSAAKVEKKTFATTKKLNWKLTRSRFVQCMHLSFTAGKT